jgi:hypothetical protein
VRVHEEGVHHRGSEATKGEGKQRLVIRDDKVVLKLLYLSAGNVLS